MNTIYPRSLTILILILISIPVLHPDSLNIPANPRSLYGKTFGEIPIPPHTTMPLQVRPGPRIYSLSIPDTPLLFHYLEYFADGEGLAYLDRALERSRPYHHFIAKKIGEYRMPPELFFLPVIESAYRTNAVSRSGASGLWQFMTNSIAPYGMIINSWMDERRDFWKSTDAALRKIHYNYEQLGDWLLALAAYNCGLGRVRRTIAASGTDDFWELSSNRLLPSETIHYVPKFLAAAAIGSYRASLSPDTNHIWNPPVVWKKILLNQPVDLELLASAATIPIELLRAGNSELSYSITPPKDIRYYLKVPAEYSDTVHKVLSGNQLKLMRYTIHIIESGDTFYGLSKKYHVPVVLIERSNPDLIPERLRIGAKVIVPLFDSEGGSDG